MATRNILAAAMLLALTGQALAAGNPLLGHWTLDMPVHNNGDGFDYCSANPAFIFMPKTEIMFGPPNAPGQTMPRGKNDVIYLVTGNTVYVSAMPPGFEGAPKYTLIGPNEMEAGQIGNCRYKRQ